MLLSPSPFDDSVQTLRCAPSTFVRKKPTLPLSKALTRSQKSYSAIFAFGFYYQQSINGTLLENYMHM